MLKSIYLKIFSKTGWNYIFFKNGKDDQLQELQSKLQNTKDQLETMESVNAELKTQNEKVITKNDLLEKVKNNF